MQQFPVGVLEMNGIYHLVMNYKFFTIIDYLLAVSTWVKIFHLIHIGLQLKQRIKERTACVFLMDA